MTNASQDRLAAYPVHHLGKNLSHLEYQGIAKSWQATFKGFMWRLSCLCCLTGSCHYAESPPQECGPIHWRLHQEAQPLHRVWIHAMWQRIRSFTQGASAYAPSTLQFSLPDGPTPSSSNHPYCPHISFYKPANQFFLIQSACCFAFPCCLFCIRDKLPIIWCRVLRWIPCGVISQWISSVLWRWNHCLCAGPTTKAFYSAEDSSGDLPRHGLSSQKEDYSQGFEGCQPVEGRDRCCQDCWFWCGKNAGLGWHHDCWNRNI